MTKEEFFKYCNNTILISIPPVEINLSNKYTNEELENIYEDIKDCSDSQIDSMLVEDAMIQFWDIVDNSNLYIE